MKKSSFLIAFLLSMLTFLLTFWTAGYTLYAAAWAESICFFVLTFLLLQKYAKPDTFGLPIVAAVILGRILLELPIRITEFRATLFSLFIPIAVICSIILAAVYFRERRPVVLILSVIIMVLLNTVVHDDWINLFHVKP